MKPLFATESNKFAQSIKLEVPANTPSRALYINSTQPYKLDSVLGQFSGSASGKLKIKVFRSGIWVEILDQDLSGTTNFAITDCGVWLNSNAFNGMSSQDAEHPKTDIVLVDNGTSQPLKIVVDFSY